MRIWEATGARQSERGGPFVATVWPDMPMDAIAAQLNADQEAGRGEWILAAEPHERRREARTRSTSSSGPRPCGRVTAARAGSRPGDLPWPLTRLGA